MTKKLNPHAPRSSWLAMHKLKKELSSASSTTQIPTPLVLAKSRGSMGTDTVSISNERKKLKCVYKHVWTDHLGWKTSVYRKNTTPKACYVCSDCLDWMRDQQLEFHLDPCQEEMNQIVGDEDVAENRKVVEDVCASAASEENVAQHAEGGHYTTPVGSNMSFEECGWNHACAVALQEAQDGDGNALFNNDESLRFDDRDSGSRDDSHRWKRRHAKKEHDRDRVRAVALRETRDCDGSLRFGKRKDVDGNCDGSHRLKGRRTEGGHDTTVGDRDESLRCEKRKNAAGICDGSHRLKRRRTD